MPVTDGDRGDGPLAFLLDPIALQRLEGGMLLVLSLLLFWKYSAAWLLYVALILAPDDPAVLDMNGMLAVAAKNDVNTAVQDFERALSANPADIEVAARTRP